MVYLKKKIAMTQVKDVQMDSSVFFTELKQQKKISNKFIVYHIKSMAAFEAVCGYIVCIIYICLNVLSQSDIITLCQTL